MVTGMIRGSQGLTKGIKNVNQSYVPEHKYFESIIENINKNLFPNRRPKMFSHRGSLTGKFQPSRFLLTGFYCMYMCHLTSLFIYL